VKRLRHFLLLVALTSLSSIVSAQCPQWIGASATPDTLAACDSSANHLQFWNDPLYWDELNQSHNLTENPLELSTLWRDTCGGAEIGFTLWLDLNNDGAPETPVSSDSIAVWPAGYLRVADTLLAFDHRPVAAGLKYRFKLELVVISTDTLASTLVWASDNQPGITALPELPNGFHRLVWRLVNADGDTLVQVQDLDVHDCAPPVVVCRSGLSANIQIDQTLTLYDSDFLQYAEDNTSPQDLLQLGIRQSANGSGFPNTNEVIFVCQTLGTQFVELWAKDLAGNVSFCETYVLVQDNAGHCGNGPNNLPGKICLKACDPNGAPVEGGVSLSAIGSGNGLPVFVMIPPVQVNGCFIPQLNALPLGPDYIFTPILDTDPTNGVTTYDLVLINRHILGLDPLSSPYKIIAADANKSNTVTSFDIVEIRKLILGIYNEFPNNNSWRFVRAAQTFPMPNNPFATPLQETTTLAELNQALPNSIDFVGVKIGDVNCTAAPNATAPADDRQQPLALRLPDLHLAAGETAEIPLQLLFDEHLLGLQMRLAADPNLLEISAVSSALPGFSNDHWLLRDHTLSVSWDDASAPRLRADADLLRLKVRAHTPLHLRDALSLQTAGLQPEAYTADQQRHPLDWWWTAAPGGATSPVSVFAAQPNPTNAGVQIPLFLPNDTDLHLNVYDATGRLVFQQQQHATAGAQHLDVPAAALSNAGVYAWRLSDGSGATWSGQVVRQ
jgi:hypothetical protein